MASDLTREEAVRLLSLVFTAGTMQDDPEWVDEMVGYMQDDPEFADEIRAAALTEGDE